MTPADSNNLYDQATVALLRRVPERWNQFDFDGLTSIESQALFLLVAAGMVERRIRFRARMPNHPIAGEATIECTGEYGFVEAMKPFLASMWEDWQDAFAEFTTGERKDDPSSVCERLRPDEWRLTDQGVLARADIDGGRQDSVLEFVMHRGFFDGTTKLLNGRIVGDSHVRGTGILVNMRKVSVDPVIPAEVTIKNWTEGAEAIAAALESRRKQAQSDSHHPQNSQSTSDGTQKQGVRKTRRERRARWLAQAMLLVQDHPNWPDREIAEKVGVDPGTLSRAKEYQAAAALARGKKDRTTRGYITRNPNTGQTDVEAYSNDGDDDSEQIDQ